MALHGYLILTVLYPSKLAGEMKYNFSHKGAPINFGTLGMSFYLCWCTA